MERRQSEEVGSVLLRYLRLAGLETPLNEHRALMAWPSVAGEAFSRYTEAVAIRNQVLTVRVSSPAARATLMMQRSNLVKKLNEMIRAQVIADISFV